MEAAERLPSFLILYLLSKLSIEDLYFRVHGFKSSIWAAPYTQESNGCLDRTHRSICRFISCHFYI